MQLQSSTLCSLWLKANFTVKGDISMARFLKYGITTGATAAAAAKAAVIAALKEPVDRVVIPTPIGLRFEVPVKSSRKLAKDSAEAVAVKDAGQDIDATDKMEITATVKLTDDGKITIKSGEGIGKVTKPGLQVPIGEGAINPVPRSMITEAVKEVLPAGKGAEIIISAPEGANIAKKTMNAKLGIKGGVSILGTTGVVKPLSLEACRRSLVPQIDVAIARGYKRILFVPGNIGERIAKEQFGVPEDAIVQTGDFVGYMLDKAVEKGVKEIIFTWSLRQTRQVGSKHLQHSPQSWATHETKSSLPTQALSEQQPKTINELVGSKHF